MTIAQRRLPHEIIILQKILKQRASNGFVINSMEMKNTKPTWIALIVASGLLCGLGLPYVPPPEKDANHSDQNHRCAFGCSNEPLRSTESFAFHGPIRPPRSTESFAVTMPWKPQSA
jgi:hypothetical protein